MSNQHPSEKLLPQLGALTKIGELQGRASLFKMCVQPGIANSTGLQNLQSFGMLHLTEACIAAGIRILPAGVLPISGWDDHCLECPSGQVAVIFTILPFICYELIVSAPHIRQRAKRGKRQDSKTRNFLSS